MLQGLRTLGYVVDDLDGAVQWYTKVLGKPPYFAEPFYVGFEVGGYELGFNPAKPGDRQPGERGGIAYWGVQDVAAEIERLAALGATVHSPARDVGGDIVIGAVTDPFGNVLGLVENRHFAPPLVAAGAGDVGARVIVKETVVPVTPAEAFALWSSARGLARWGMPPARVELRPGGHYEIYFNDDAPYGARGGEGCRVLSFLPGRMLSFTWNAPPQQPLTRMRHTWVVLEFEEDTHGTRVRLSHLGWPESEWSDASKGWQKTFAYFEAAWGSVMEMFRAHFFGPQG